MTQVCFWNGQQTRAEWQQNDGEVLSNFGRGVSAARVSQPVCSQSDGQTALYARHFSQMRKQQIPKRLQCSLEHSWTLTLKWKLSFCASNQSKPMFCLLDSGGCEDESCWCWCCQSRPRGLWRRGSEWINVVQDDASICFWNGQQTMAEWLPKCSSKSAQKSDSNRIK